MNSQTNVECEINLYKLEKKRKKKKIICANYSQNGAIPILQSNIVLCVFMIRGNIGPCS